MTGYFDNDENKDKYFDGVINLIQNERWIYVEGNNKFFYQSYNEISHIPMIGNKNCSDIISLVTDNINFYGILDLDFSNNNSIDRVYTINYYSIENLSLLYDKRYFSIKDEVINHINQHSLSLARIHKILVHIDRFPNKRAKKLSLTLDSKKHHSQYHNYINNKILSEILFIQFMDLKRVVEFGASFLRQIGRINRIDYIDDLFNKLPNQRISFLFENNVYTRMKYDLNI